MEVMLAAMQFSQAASQAGGVQGLKDLINGNLQSGGNQVGGGPDSSGGPGGPSGPGGPGGPGGPSQVGGPSGTEPTGEGGGIMQMLQQLLQLLMMLMQQMSQGGMDPNEDSGGPGQNIGNPPGGPTGTPPVGGPSGGGCPGGGGPGGGGPGGGGPGGGGPGGGSPSPSSPPPAGSTGTPSTDKPGGGTNPTTGTGGTSLPTAQPKPSGPTGNSTDPLSTEPQKGPLSEAEGKEMAKNVAEQLQKDFGFTPEQAAGIAGNLWHESDGMNANVNEYAYAGNEPYGQPNSTDKGYGWAQWSYDRKPQFINWCKENGLDPASPAANYGFIKHELENNESATVDAVKGTSTPEDAATMWRKVYERAEDPQDTKRTTAARILYDFMNGD
ncbi:hypothetical protein HLB44_12645 [Aquincola sp. S2]|uniref:Phage tail lysozyme domain-containing protein n=1 Tax=Pseudaquabacterium terrae TaxID=2732868 RepID=A0ABX2EGT2_9BURK|nr:phage tail tip lysozyme [Aquabacterium terrae]NRF67834.1 hypothetical protein [Aquabacterium terrae]